MPTHSTRLRRALVLGSAAAVLLFPSDPATVAAATDRLPDLRMDRLSQFRLQTTSSGRRRLRFTTTILNVGVGPMDLRASRPDTSRDYMSVRQRVRNAGYESGWRSVATAATLRFTGDGHNHWHVQGLERYLLYSLDRPSTTPLRGAKVGFCFFDTWNRYPGLAGNPGRRIYYESFCGTRYSLTARMGLSIGWGDVYPWDFAYQWIDITGIPRGRYRVCATADPQNRFLETTDRNNSAWTDLRITSSGVTILASGRTACTPLPAP